MHRFRRFLEGYSESNRNHLSPIDRLQAAVGVRVILRVKGADSNT